MFQAERPLADRASEDLITLCKSLAGGGLDQADELTVALRQLGPRVGSAVKALAETVSAGPLHLEASWAEPGHPSVVADWSTEDARWVARFIEGNDLDAEIYVLSGTAVTVSDRERWLIDEDGGGPVFVQIGELTAEDARRARPTDRVSLEVEATSRVTPTGEVHTTRKARRLLSAGPATEEGAGAHPDHDDTEAPY
jgi:cold shock CspA family protein